MLQNPSRTIERGLTHLRLTTEEVFCETFCVLDEAKENPKDASFMMRGLWDNIYCDLRELDEDASEDELQLATSELVYVVMLMLSMVDGSWYTKLTMVLMEQITANSSHYDHLQMLFMPNLWRYGEEKVKAYLNEYMESDDVWISDDINECLSFIKNEDARLRKEQANKEALKQAKTVIIKDSEVKIDSPQNVVYPQEGSTANIGCDQQNSTFPTFLPPASEVQGQIGNQKNEQKSLTER